MNFASVIDEKENELRANPDMIIIARESRGFTQSDLADRSGISQANISKFESGRLAVTLDHVTRIAKATILPEPFFFLPERRYEPLSDNDGDTGIYHSRRASMSKSDMKVTHAILNRLRIQVSRLLKGAEIEHDYKFPQLRANNFGGNIEEIARQVRKAWELQSGPIHSMVDVIEAAGGIIFMNQFSTMKLNGITQYVPETGLPPLVFLNADLPPDQQRWTLAHELGHIVLHCHYQARLDGDDVEDQANRFAAEFLLPERDAGPALFNLNLPTLARLKSYWKVSMSALIYRAHKLGRISDRQRRSLYQQMGANKYRRNEPVSLPAEEPKLLQELLKIHREFHGYDLLELSRLLFVFDDELRYIYGLQPGPNDWVQRAEEDDRNQRQRAAWANP